MIRIYLSIVLTFLLLVGCGGSISDGSEVGNPIIVTCEGTITNDGIPVEGLSVQLFRAQANPLKEGPEQEFITTEQGTFQFDSVWTQTHYRLYTHTADTGQMAYVDTLLLSSDTTLLATPLLEPGTIRLTENNLTEYTGTVLFARGLPLYQNISSDTVSLKLPQGAVDIAHFDTETDTLVVRGIELKEIQIEEGNALEINDTYITASTAPSGASTATVGVAETYKTNSVTISLNHPAEYRFAWLNYDSTVVIDSDYWKLATTTVWSSDTSISLSFPEPGKNKIRVQARSALDTLIMNEWSSYLSIQTTLP